MPIKRFCKNCNAKCTGLYCRKCFDDSKRISQEDKDLRLRKWNLNKKYGLTIEDFEMYWFAQMGKCFICRQNMSMPKKGRGQSLDTAVMDHDHATGKFRGLLCNGCNKGLGLFKDSITILNNAIKYLE